MGKTHLDQFASGLNGTRAPYGAVPNAFDAAYVVAKGQVDFSLGTDTAGSGRVPASLNNIVGIKPSKGLISTRGVLPAAQSVDCVSVFARTVELAFKVLEATMGFDPRDPYSRQLDLIRQRCGTSFRFGVPSVLAFFGDQQAEAAFAQAVERLRSMGGVQIAAEFEAMHYLIAGDDVAVANLTRQQAFFAAHIQSWVGQLCDALARHPKARFYVAVGELTRAFLSVEAQGFDMLA